MSKPVQLPSGAWRIRWLDADGKRQSKTLPTFDLARSELRRLEVATEETLVRRDRYGSEAMTVAEAWSLYEATRKPDSTERRHERLMSRARQHYKLHIGPHLAERRLDELTPRLLREWVAKLATTKTQRPGEKNETGRTLSAGTIRAIVVTLRQIAKACDVPLQVLLAAPLRQKTRRSRPRALQSAKDVRALLDACRLPWFKVAAAIACHAGARLGEVASLRWKHIGTDTITIALSWEGPLKARYEDDEEAARVVPLSDELAAVLAAWREVTNGKPDDRIVLVNGKRPLREHYDDLAARTKTACKRAGLVPLTFHALRATWATLLADQGLPLPKLSVLLGHTDIATTAIYIRPESEHAALDPRARIGDHVLATSAALN